MNEFLKSPRSSLDLTRPRIMGVLNVTPDSFSDGGAYETLRSAVVHAEAMVADGVDIIDVGGESTRPGAATVSVEEELARVLPVVKALRARFDHWISVDTSSPEVMRSVAAAGADMINDVRALKRTGALAAAADSGLPVCLMHMQGQPGTMQKQPNYTDVSREVADFLLSRVGTAEAAGIETGRIVLDPGFGFGKTLAHNLTLLSGLQRICDYGYPVLVGVSRKRMIGDLTGRRDPQSRVAGSVAAALFAAEQGARVLRVHDVPETRDALAVWQRLRNGL